MKDCCRRMEKEIISRKKIAVKKKCGSLSTRLRSVYGNSDHSSRSVFMTLMLEEKAWLSVFTLIHPKAFYQVEIRTLQASSSTPNSLVYVFMDLAWCTGAQSVATKLGA